MEVDEPILQRLAVVGRQRVLHLQVPGLAGVFPEPAHVGDHDAADRHVPQLLFARGERRQNGRRLMGARDPDELPGFDEPRRLARADELALELPAGIDAEIELGHEPRPSSA
jgi:hypothetical protein